MRGVCFLCRWISPYRPGGATPLAWRQRFLVANRVDGPRATSLAGHSQRVQNRRLRFRRAAWDYSTNSSLTPNS